MSNYNPFRGDDNPFEEDPTQQIFPDEKGERREYVLLKSLTPKSKLHINLRPKGYA